MNSRIRQINNLFQNKNSVPYFNRMENVWKVFVDGRKEVGDIEYIFSEFAKTGCCYRYHLFPDEKYFGHAHTFSGVLLALHHYPKTFDITGFEEDYSNQQIEFLTAVQKKLASFID